MPNTRSAEKQARVSLRRQTINRSLKSRAKTFERKIRTLVEQGNQQEAAKLLPEFQGALDRASKKQAIHSNKASRTKSRVAALVATKAK